MQPTYIYTDFCSKVFLQHFRRLQQPRQQAVHIEHPPSNCISTNEKTPCPTPPPIADSGSASISESAQILPPSFKISKLCVQATYVSFLDLKPSLLPLWKPPAFLWQVFPSSAARSESFLFRESTPSLSLVHSGDGVIRYTWRGTTRVIAPEPVWARFKSAWPKAERF